jgi:hypothetical protein
MKLPNPKPADREKLAATTSNYAKLRDWLGGETPPSEPEILAAIRVEISRAKGSRHAIMQRLNAAYIALKQSELNAAIAACHK